MEHKLVLCDNLEGWDEVGVGMEVHEAGNICLFMVDSFDIWASLVAQMVKSLPAIWETGVRFLGWEDSLEKEMATHSSILAWKISWIEEPGGLQSMGWQRVGYD